MLQMVTFFLSVVGCPNPTPPKNAWVERDPVDKVAVRCNFTGETWYLTCKDTQWVGTYNNCTLGKKIIYIMNCINSFLLVTLLIIF